MNVTYTSREQIEVYRFPWPVAIGVPLVAIILQAFLPIRMHFFGVFDLPLLVTIFFSVARRNPITGLLTGSAIGLVQDALSGKPLGIFGIAKTVVGYIASSLGVKIDVENPGGGHDPEFVEWRWEPVKNLPGLIIPFKRKVYERVVAEFSKLAKG